MVRQAIISVRVHFERGAQSVGVCSPVRAVGLASSQVRLKCDCLFLLLLSNPVPSAFRTTTDRVKWENFSWRPSEAAAAKLVRMSQDDRCLLARLLFHWASVPGQSILHDRPFPFQTDAGLGRRLRAS